MCIAQRLICSLLLMRFWIFNYIWMHYPWYGLDFFFSFQTKIKQQLIGLKPRRWEQLADWTRGALAPIISITCTTPIIYCGGAFNWEKLVLTTLPQTYNYYESGSFILCTWSICFVMTYIQVEMLKTVETLFSLVHLATAVYYTPSAHDLLVVKVRIYKVTFFSLLSPAFFRVIEHLPTGTTYSQFFFLLNCPWEITSRYTESTTLNAASQLKAPLKRHQFKRL